MEKSREKCLLQWASARSYRLAWAPSLILYDALEELEKHENEGILDESQSVLIKRWYSLAEQIVKNYKTLMMIAFSTANMTGKITFNLYGEKFSALLPPNYGDRGAVIQMEQQVEADILDCGEKNGFRIEKFRGPYKNLAVRIGIGLYGRNNLLYVDGMGSYVRLMGYVIDQTLDTDGFQMIQSFSTGHLSNCETCGACAKACPTKAINSERFLLKIDRCLSNLSDEEKIWPDFVYTAPNQCLVGCLTCQKVCPVNRGFTGVGVERELAFTDEESDYIKSNANNNFGLESSIVDKLCNAGFESYRPYILRNLRRIVGAYK
jgi:epoxyqueuosine reductase